MCLDEGEDARATIGKVARPSSGRTSALLVFCGERRRMTDRWKVDGGHSSGAWPRIMEASRPQQPDQPTVSTTD